MNIISVQFKISANRQDRRSEGVSVFKVYKSAAKPRRIASIFRTIYPTLDKSLTTVACFRN